MLPPANAAARPNDLGCSQALRQFHRATGSRWFDLAASAGVEDRIRLLVHWGHLMSACARAVPYTIVEPN
jgi:hypothetical protein